MYMPMAVGKSGMSVEIVIYVRGSAAGEMSRRNCRSVIHALRCSALRARDSVVVNAQACAKVKAKWRDRKRRASTPNGEKNVFAGTQSGNVTHVYSQIKRL